MTTKIKLPWRRFGDRGLFIVPMDESTSKCLCCDEENRNIRIDSFLKGDDPSIVYFASWNRKVPKNTYYLPLSEIENPFEES